MGSYAHRQGKYGFRGGFKDSWLNFPGITEVWAWNFHHEFKRLLDLGLNGRTVLAVDIEFPGFLQQEPRQASRELRYTVLRGNVDNLKPIQLGAALTSEDGCLLGAWSFNLHFDPRFDRYSAISLAFLQQAGLDFCQHSTEGIQHDLFGRQFLKLMGVESISWVVFSGFYDWGYILKMVSGQLLPISIADFDASLHKLCPKRYDLRQAEPHGSLTQLAEKHGRWHRGYAHTGGSDALLTLELYVLAVSAEARAVAAVNSDIAGCQETTEHASSTTPVQEKALNADVEKVLGARMVDENQPHTAVKSAEESLRPAISSLQESTWEESRLGNQGESSSRSAVCDASASSDPNVVHGLVAERRRERVRWRPKLAAGNTCDEDAHRSTTSCPSSAPRRGNRKESSAGSRSVWKQVVPEEESPYGKPSKWWQTQDCSTKRRSSWREAALNTCPAQEWRTDAWAEKEWSEDQDDDFSAKHRSSRDAELKQALKAFVSAEGGSVDGPRLAAQLAPRFNQWIRTNSGRNDGSFRRWVDATPGVRVENCGQNRWRVHVS